MILLLFLGLAAAYPTGEEERALQSPALLRNLFSGYQKLNGRHYTTLAEQRTRLGLFRKSLEFIVSQNKAHGREWESGLNFLSDRTEEERTQYLGFNGTLFTPHSTTSDDEPRPLSLPSSFSWIDRGAVLPPYDQAKCGSCWSFSAAAALEGAYKAASGKLKKLSEQEYLDCSLKSSVDGCNGGFYYQAWDYNKKQGRMGRGNDRPYRARTGKCTDLTENSLKSHTVTGYWAAPNRNEADTLYGITQGVLSVAFEVTETFSAYKSGILRDNTCSRGSNHAVSAVAYTPSYILIRNSWGSRWGDRGFVKFARGHHNCETHRFTAYPKLKATGKGDNDTEDAATVYDPENSEGPTDPYNPGPAPPCEDKGNFCDKGNYCGTSYESYCRKTCGKCGESGNECPEGTVRCSDGKCRHTHMC